jgi:O-6-methylguanine DNA methyltransferase
MTDRVRISTPARPGPVLYSRYASPVGELLIIGDEFSLKELAFRKSKSGIHPVDTKIAKGENRSIAACCSYLDHYFRSTSRTGNNALLDQKVRIEKKSLLLHITAAGLSLTIDCSAFTPNELMVYAELAKVPFGSTISYGALARRSGFTGGARFIGNAMAKNMVPIIIPCHRVIRTDGLIGNYSGGVHIKKYLLEMESHKAKVIINKKI